MLPQRKSNRLKYYDYNKFGAYFITICTNNRNPVLAEIRKGSASEPIHHTLLPCGIATADVISHLSERFPVHVSAYVIMPDHIHMILHLQSHVDDPAPRADLKAILCAYKSLTTRAIKQQYPQIRAVFQTSFFEHVIRNRQDYEEKEQYIRNNPAKWYYER